MRTITKLIQDWHEYIFKEYEDIITTPWIYHNSDLWLISLSSDWENWMTIADKNLWADTVYNDWDALSESNCWWYFQWWNNYMFPFTWNVTTSNTQVDATGYWPWNYYNDSTFITDNANWSSTYNDNLRWGRTGTNEAMLWPCSIWYHISSKNEQVALVNILTTLNINTNNGNCMKTYLKMPFAGYREYTSSDVENQGYHASYWSSTAYTYVTAYFFSFGPSTLGPESGSGRTRGFSIRPFKNEPVVPTTNWSVLYQ